MTPLWVNFARRLTDNRVRALDAATGQALWSDLVAAPAVLMPAVVSYQSADYRSADYVG